LRRAFNALASASSVRLTAVFARLPDVDVLLVLSRSCAGEGREQATPSALAVEDAEHLVATRTVALEMAMLQFDARTVFALSDEAYLYFFRFGSGCQSALISQESTSRECGSHEST
jgi:hypothetical protein